MFVHGLSQRLLRGHPNIVYLIDAAWAKMPTGAFEVYILMEYCPGMPCIPAVVLDSDRPWKVVE